MCECVRVCVRECEEETGAWKCSKTAGEPGVKSEHRLISAQQGVMFLD